MRVRTLASLAFAAALAFAAVGCATTGQTASPSTAPASPTAAPAALTVFFEENCQVELIAPSGQRILIDVWNPAALSKPAAATDILLTTHTHSDHYVESFASSFPGKTITNKTEQETFGDIRVTSIAASHYDNDIDAADPTNHIFVIDFNGFHIAHLGSTGQDELTAVQLAAIGKPDIAFSVLQDLSNLASDEKRPVKIVEQMSPLLLIPTHTKLASAQAAGAKWPNGLYSKKPSVTISKDKLPTSTTVLFMGQLGPTFGAALKYTETTW